MAAIASIKSEGRNVEQFHVDNSSMVISWDLIQTAGDLIYGFDSSLTKIG